MLRRVLVLALGLPLLVHCAGPVITGTTDESALVADDDAGDAHDAGDAGDAGDARSDAGDPGDAGEDAAPATGDVEDAAPPPKKPSKPTKPVQPGDGGDDASTTDLASTYPDPSTVRLGPLPEGSGGCASAPGPSGLLGAPLLAMLGLVGLRRRRS